MRPPAWSACLLLVLRLPAGAGVLLRGHLRTLAVPGDEASSWGAQELDSAELNPWALLPVVPGLGNLYPSAPLEKLSNSWGNILTGAAPRSPVEGVDAEFRSEDVQRQLPPDWLPPYSYPHTFPQEATVDGQEVGESPMVPLEDKEWVGQTDKLHGENYPLVAPMDRLPSSRAVVASEDWVPADFARYLEQEHVARKAGDHAKRVGTVVSRTDTNKDDMVSYKEYRNETEGRQNKSSVESERLWNKYHTSDFKDMTRGEYERLVQAGFDLGGIPRSDVSSERLLSSGISGRGFWGNGAVCPSGTYITGMRLKVAPHSDNRDNTGLNSIAVRCGKDGEEKETSEGPDGKWSAWADCPDGQRAFKLRVRADVYSPGQDNSGINDIEVGCRSPDLTAHSRIRFGHKLKASKTVVVAESPVAAGGGWLQQMRCGPAAALCGIRANIVRDQSQGGDNLGIANLKMYCCSAPVDCSAVCSKKVLEKEAAAAVAALKCKVCRKAASVR